MFFWCGSKIARCVQASTAFHLVYITALRLVDIAPSKVEEGNRNRSFGPILLVLVHVAAVVISCVNFFIETVSICDNPYNPCLEWKLAGGEEVVLQGVSFCRGLADHHHPHSSCHCSQLHHIQVLIKSRIEPLSFINTLPQENRRP